MGVRSWKLESVLGTLFDEQQVPHPTLRGFGMTGVLWEESTARTSSILFISSPSLSSRAIPQGGRRGICWFFRFITRSCRREKPHADAWDSAGRFTILPTAACRGIRKFPSRPPEKSRFRCALRRCMIWQ